MEKTAYLQMAETEQQHWWFTGRRTILECLIAQQFHEKAPHNVLEIGAGTGGNLSMLAKFGVLSATEMNDDARLIAISRTGVNVLRGSLPNGLPTFPHKFNLICLLDVLEHIEDDLGSLRAIGELMAPDGKLLLTVPGHPWMWSRHDEFLHHKRRYTRAGLQTVVENAGMHVHRISYFNTLLFPAAVLGRALDRLRPREIPLGTGMPPLFVNTLLKRVFSSEAALLSKMNLPVGVSLLAIVGPS
ncbi:MAG: class I SAM-dependent methyltransferase [Burkholderiales bacterium]